MAIDIKTLTINSHVLYDGERVEVWSLGQEHGLYDIVVHDKAKTYESNMFHNPKEPYLIRCDVDRLSPIPITEELLTEIAEKYAQKDDGCTYFEKYDGYTYFNIWLNDEYRITGTIYTERPNEFNVDILKYSGNEFVDDTILITANDVKYLHTLEAFIRLTCGVSLT